MMISFSGLFERWNELDSSNRLKFGYALVAVLAVAVGWSLVSGRLSELERKRQARETVLKELLPLKAAYRAARQSSDMLAGRMASLRPDDTLSKIIDDTGIKGKGVKLVPVKGEERNGLQEEAADVRIEWLNANEAVNLLYRLEKGSRPVTVRKAALKVRFDDPARLDLSMTIALLKPAPGQQR